jgi:hypothetical protein
MDNRVVTYNDEISISHPVKDLDVTGAVKADKLYQFLGKVKIDEIEIVEEDNAITLTTGKAKAGLAMQAEIKLPLDQVGDIEDWEDLPENFIEALKFVYPSCGHDMSRPLLTCVHVNHDGFIEGSDSNCITRYTLEEFSFDTFLLPSSSASTVVKLNPTQISLGKSWVHFKTEDDSIISCRIFSNKDKFVDTTPFLDVEGIEVTLPEAITEIMDRAMVFAKQDHQLDETIKITLKESRMIMECKSESDNSWFREEARMRYKQDPLTFFITPYLLNWIISKTKDCTIAEDRLCFKSPAKEEGDTSGDWIYVTALKNKID